MTGVVGAIVILLSVLVWMCIVYKNETGRSFFKDLIHDIFG